MPPVHNSRVSDLAQKAWRYLLQTLERPTQIPFLLFHTLKGAHLGELLKLNRTWFKQAGIKTVIDVGAHHGEFSSAARAVFLGARIYAFEPLPDCCKKLREKMRGCERFQAFQIALGERRGQTSFWRATYSQSSSALPPAELLRQVFPWTAQVSPATVEMDTLDCYLDRMELLPKVLLKMDIQGYEEQVLRGAPRLLEKTHYVLAEVSFSTLYEGQSLFTDVYARLTENGFCYVGSFGLLESPLDGSLLQADALFARSQTGSE